TDFLIQKAVERKYGKDVKLKTIDNKWEKRARSWVLNRVQ
ncbi:glutamine amidotransferase, partial [Candidatus Roizmanbacteria bacterium CG11_big_fil_rev_8_21_14_0_20_37_16]